MPISACANSCSSTAGHSSAHAPSYGKHLSIKAETAPAPRPGNGAGQSHERILLSEPVPFQRSPSQMWPIVPEGRVENSPGWSEAESWEGVFRESVRPGGTVRTSLGTSCDCPGKRSYPDKSPQDEYAGPRNPAAASPVVPGRMRKCIGRWTLFEGRHAWAQSQTSCERKPSVCSMQWRRERDSNPRYPFRHNGFQDRRYQPLTHPSARVNHAPAIVWEAIAPRFEEGSRWRGTGFQFQSPALRGHATAAVRDSRSRPGSTTGSRFS